MMESVDKAEARLIAEQRVTQLRGMSYADLRSAFLKRPTCAEVVGPSGHLYQVETEAIWDDRRLGHLRVLVAVDDGRGWAALIPLTEDFIIAPDGSYIGE
jgi:hypothetical protein